MDTETPLAWIFRFKSSRRCSRKNWSTSTPRKRRNGTCLDVGETHGKLYVGQGSEPQGALKTLKEVRHRRLVLKQPPPSKQTALQDTKRIKKGSRPLTFLGNASLCRLGFPFAITWLRDAVKWSLNCGRSTAVIHKHQRLLLCSISQHQCLGLEAKRYFEPHLGCVSDHQRICHGWGNIREPLRHVTPRGRALKRCQFKG